MTSVTSWITLMTMLAVVEPLMPRTAIKPTNAEKHQRDQQPAPAAEW